MRPTSAELLAGMRRLLTEEVQPAVGTPLAVEILRSVVDGLERLERQWSRNAEFLPWDIAALEDLLAEAVEPLNPLDPPLARRVEAALVAGREHGPQLASLQNLDARDDELRAVLAEVIRLLAGRPVPPPVVVRIREHLREAVRRRP